MFIGHGEEWRPAERHDRLICASLLLHSKMGYKTASREEKYEYSGNTRWELFPARENVSGRDLGEEKMALSLEVIK